MYLQRVLRANGKESGQLLILVALVLPVLVLFAGFAIDFGFGFLTRAELAKASDAVALSIMRNLGKGQTTATSIGQSVFSLNYNASSSLNASAPSLSVSYSTDPTTGEPVVNVVATATIKTFFIRLAGLPTLTVTDSSQATRPPVILSLVLDRSGSMSSNGGATALPTAVDDFLSFFIQNTDRLGEVSFASNDTTDVAITKTFVTPIQNSMNSMSFTGATYAQGGLNDAETEVQGVASPPPNAVKVIVYFTDGLANTNQDKLNCDSGTFLNYGGFDPPSTGWTFLNSSTGSQYFTAPGTCSFSSGTFPATAPSLIGAATPPKQIALSESNITTEAEYRAVTWADSMRAQGITIYTIGLGSDPSTTFLQEVANDPASPLYDPSQPVGLYEHAVVAGDLDGAFQDIASKILLRLTQ